MNSFLNVTDPAVYRIQIVGRVDVEWSDFMTGIDQTVSHEKGPTLTVITGTVPDQAGLFGMLCQIRDLGLALVSVEFLPPYEGK